MKNTIIKQMAGLLLALMILVVGIGATSAFIANNFVSVEQYQSMLEEKDGQIKKLKTTLVATEETYRLDVAQLKGELSKVKTENVVLKEKEKHFNSVLRFSSIAKKVTTRGGELPRINKTILHQSSNLSLADIKQLLKGKPIYEAAERIYYWDKKGVNAFLTMGTSQKESGFGEATIGKNAFGTKNASTGRYYKFTHFNQSVDKFASGILNGYFKKGVTDLSRIQKSYCPPNSQWDEGIRDNISVLYKHLQQYSYTNATNN